jgi:SAM-dependent methyltransferase
VSTSLEQHQRLSQSILWDLLREFYERRGADAWTSGVLPHYATNNPRIADAYAEVVVAWLREHAPSRSAERPAHIIELGCGPGRFAFLFLRALAQRERLDQAGIRYVATDVSQRNLDFLRAHRAARDLFDAGVLDVARFDAVRDESLTMQVSGVRLEPNGRGGPLVLLSNYCFDSLPQDLFLLRDGQLFEMLAKVDPHDGDGPEPAIKGLHLSYEPRRAAPEYYAETEVNDVLRGYRSSGLNGSLLFPSGALSCLRNVERMAGGPVLLVASDKGQLIPRFAIQDVAPDMEMHGDGCFSMMVNFDAIAEYARRRGGDMLAPSHGAGALYTVVAALGHRIERTEVQAAFERSVEKSGPDDFLYLAQRIGDQSHSLDFGEALAFVRFSGGDPQVWNTCSMSLIKQASRSPAELRAELRSIARVVWRNYYDLNEPFDVALTIGSALYEIGDHEDAIPYLEQSYRSRGSAASLFQVGRCLQALKRRRSAIEHLERALAMDPHVEDTLQLLGILSQPVADQLLARARWDEASERLPAVRDANLEGRPAVISGSLIESTE